MPRQELKRTCTYHDISRRLKEEATNDHPPTERQAILDDHITSLEAHRKQISADLLSLKTMRNRCSPISRIPTEILTHILLETIQPVGRYKPQSWQIHVELTRVCTHWRSIAMQCPQFWSCVPFISSKGPAKHVDMMLARSMDYPLSIRKDFEEDEERDTDSEHSAMDDSLEASSDAGSSNGGRISSTLRRAQYLQAQTHRLQQLHLRVEPSLDQLQQYEYLIEQPAPSLETLAVDLTSHPLRNSARSLFGPEIVLSSRTMPSLRSLRLSGFVMRTEDWETLSRSAFSTQNLTTLKLSVDGAPPYDLLLEMLRASPRLHTLKLFNCITRESTANLSESSSNTIADKVHLPGLAYLALDQIPSTAAAVRFLSDLVFPSNSKIEIRRLSVDQPPRGSSSPQVRSELIRKLFLYCGSGGLEDSTQAEVRRYETVRMHIDDSSTPCTGLRLSNPCLCPSNGRTTNAFGIHSCPGDGSTSMTLYGEKLPKLILEHLPQGTSVLHVIHIDTDFARDFDHLGPSDNPHDDSDWPTTEDWRRFFREHPSIRELRLDLDDMHRILNALGPHPSLSMSQSNSSIGRDTAVFATQTEVSPVDEIPLPLLRSLSFAAGVFVDRGTGGPLTTPGLGSSNYSALKAMLIMRGKHGLPIASIGLTSPSTLSPAQHEMKEEICAINGQGTVVWVDLRGKVVCEPEQ